MGEVGRWVPNTRRRHSLAIGNSAVLAGSMLNVALNSLQATCILFHLVPIFGLGVLPLVLVLPTCGGILEGDGINGCYLVDPASSHMLVSKIKPCMFKKLVVGPWVGLIGPPLVCIGWLVPSAGDALLALIGWVVPPALRTTAKAFAKDVFINQERKLGARRRSDTVLVSTINDADQGSADVTFRTPLAPYEKSKSLGSGGSMVARLKLKGIDGRYHQEWSLRLNLTQHGETYQVQT
ncbi:hypothetical protein RJT34_20870 [Clitoria ternatea]|uniref:Uncharacterized protein n=1 Tax=Clitoria ternatea TaxID=43366 RepID=A0AAN9ITX0_CLITE